MFAPKPPSAVCLKPHHQRGVAIIIVLAFVVLLTGLVLAFFSRAISDRQVSNSSANQAKVELLAQGVMDVVTADLKQEVIAGSAPTPTPNLALYVPKVPATAVPALIAPGGTAGYENLLKRSAYQKPLYSGANYDTATIPAPNRAANVSTLTPSQNGRFISPARWNKALLLAKNNTAPDNDVDLTPVGATVAAGNTPATWLNNAPDWILVARDGSNPTTFNPNMVNRSTATATAVTGRYAYMIYDEGGTLDMNAAGFPSTMTSAQSGYKNSLAFASLGPPPSGAGILTNPQVDNLVGWRNYASASTDWTATPPVLASLPLTGPFPGAGTSGWTASTGTNYNNFAQRYTKGFLTTANVLLNVGQSDRMFASRQELMRLMLQGIASQTTTTAGKTDRTSVQKALQYMGTFSRALEQPSFVPAHIQYPTTAPSINAVASSPPPAAGAVDSYLGNNDAAGTSLGGVIIQDLINPSILTVRVKTAFTRQDINRTPAVVGEPLVKRRFALSRLAEISYNATDTTDSLTDPTMKGKNHIKDWFGLSRASASAPWVYNPVPVSSSIRTLAVVVAANREPTFAELLKASINVGSLGKGGPNLHNEQGNYQYVLDTSVDYQVLQIMANLIDQYDADSYPTAIQIGTGTAARTFRGTEDLPYFYRYHPMAVVTKLPSVILNKTDKVEWHNVGEKPGTKPFKTTQNCAPGTLSPADGGEAVYLYVPDVWNPHDASATLNNPAGSRPANFRLAVVTQDPVGQTGAWETGTISKAYEDYYQDIPMGGSISRVTKRLDMATTAFIFTDNGGKLFREPTLLWRADAPTGINLTPDTGSLAGPHTDANTGVSYYGVQIGKTPVSYSSGVNAAKYFGVPASTDYIFQGTSLEPIQQLPVGGGYPQYTFRLQYQDPIGGGWITYDEKYPDFHGINTNPNLVVSKADYPNGKWMNPYSSLQIRNSATGYDPRTARFGIGTGNDIEKSGPPMLEQGARDYYNSDTNEGNDVFAKSRATIMVTQRPYRDRGNEVQYSNPGMTSDPGKNAQMRWFGGVGYSSSNSQPASPHQYDGLLGQNDPSLVIYARDDTTKSSLYYEDADGVARRAMGAYVLKDPNTKMVPDSKNTDAYNNLEGQPLASANTYTINSFGVGTPTAQNQSRPLMLNRPFRSVAEMSAAFRGTPWKQIDFFTPESGDAFLLDTFCLNEPPASGMVAGKVNLNTRQAPVLKAVLAGAYRDEQANYATPPNYGSLNALTTNEADNVTTQLMAITTNPTSLPWRGPLVNVSDLVGRYVPTPNNSGTATDLYIFRETVMNQSYAYAGLSGALDGSDNLSGTPPLGSSNSYRIQRMREAAIRPLAGIGQTRVWNLLIDVVAQTGQYSVNATKLEQFVVNGEKRYWVHVAIDRYTGEVIDKQIEAVAE